MEAGRKLFSSSPPPLHPPRKRPTSHLSPSAASPSSSVPVAHEQAAHAVTSLQTTAISGHFPASVLCREQRDDFRPSLHLTEDKTLQAILDRRRMENAVSSCEEQNSHQYNQHMKEFKSQLLYWPGLWYLISSSSPEEKNLLPLSSESLANETAKIVDIIPSGAKQNISNSITPWDVLSLSKKAVMVSKEAVSVAENSFSFSAAELDPSLFQGSGPGEFGINVPIEEEATVRSKRLLERQSKKCRVPKNPTDIFHKVSSRKDKKINNKDFDPNDPLRLFLWGPETRQLLTAKEEWELSVQIQELMRLEKVKQRLQLQFGCEPTLVEWAEAVRMNCWDLCSRLHSGKSSREKMINANSRLVVHVARQYLHWGLSLQDLLQEGSMGLMKSLEKFKPQVGCRFSTYAYWWIRQSIRKAVVLKSRTIRLPENVHALLTQIKNARKSYIQEGHHPTNEELAKRVGITVEKMEMLLASARNPLSIQQTAWRDEGAAFQEITADPGFEIPEISATKQLMRRHVHNLLSILSPRERQIIQLRYGIHDGECKSLLDIGTVLGVSKERVRQVESRALSKLKHHLSSEGLEAYRGLLI